jgi:hypothetical protein
MAFLSAPNSNSDLLTDWLARIASLPVDAIDDPDLFLAAVIVCSALCLLGILAWGAWNALSDIFSRDRFQGLGLS